MADEIVLKLSGTSDALVSAVNKARSSIQGLGLEVTTLNKQPAADTLAKGFDTAATRAGQLQTSLKGVDAASTAAATSVSKIGTALQTKAGSLFGDIGGQVKAMTLGFVSAQAVIGGVSAAFRTLTGFVEGSVAAYAAAEAGQKKLTTALQSQGVDVPRVAGQYNELAASLQKTTVYSDDLLTEMQALLVQVGNVAPAQMKAALKAATDLASGLGIDLRQATMLVGKAFEGETGSLKRYGIVIDDAKLKAEGMPAVLDAIQQRFGGQASAEIETYAGKVKLAANAWDDFQETVGKSIIDDPLLLRGLKEITGQIGDITDKASTGIPTITEFWARLAGAKEAGAVIAWMSTVLRLQDQVNAGMRSLQANVKTPAIFTPVVAPDKGSAGVAAWFAEQERVSVSTRRSSVALSDAQRAAASHAAAIRSLTDAYTGQQAILAARNSVEAITQAMVSKGITLAMMTDNQQKTINRTMATAVEVYARWGRQAPADIQAVYAATFDYAQLIDRMPTLISAAATDFTKFGTSIDLNKLFQPEAVRQAGVSAGKVMVSGWSDALASDAGRISQAVQSAFTGGGGVAGAARAIGTMFATDFLGAIGGMLGGPAGVAAGQLLGSFVVPLVEKLGGAFRGVVGWVSELPKAARIAMAALVPIIGIPALFANRGRDIVKDFAADQGGFDALRTQLNALGAEGEKLWIALTQGVGRNNPKEAAAAIQAVKDAWAKTPLGLAAPSELAAAAGYQTRQQLQAVADKAKTVYDYMVASGRYSAAQIADAFEKSKTAQLAAMDDTQRAAIAANQTRVDAYKKQLSELNAEYDKLFADVADEASEEVIGDVEAAQRARMDAIVQERQAVEAQLEEANAALQTSMAEVDDSVTTVDTSLRNQKGVWDDWAGNAITRAREVAREVNAISFGRSPGGLKEIPLKLTESTHAMGTFRRHALHEMALVQKSVMALADDMHIEARVQSGPHDLHDATKRMGECAHGLERAVSAMNPGCGSADSAMTTAHHRTEQQQHTGGGGQVFHPGAIVIDRPILKDRESMQELTDEVIKHFKHQMTNRGFW